jgi:hypothetical protein
MAIEEYPQGKQLMRWRSWPRFSLVAVVAGIVCAALAIGAANGGGAVATAVFGVFAIALFARTVRDAAAATGSIVRILHAMGDPSSADLVVISRKDEGR